MAVIHATVNLTYNGTCHTVTENSSTVDGNVVDGNGRAYTCVTDKSRPTFVGNKHIGNGISLTVEVTEEGIGVITNGSPFNIVKIDISAELDGLALEVILDGLSRSCGISSNRSDSGSVNDSCQACELLSGVQNVLGCIGSV